MKLTVSKKVLKIVNDQNAISRIDSIVDDWLCRFNATLHQTLSSAGDVPASFADLFHSNSFWRDALALSWQLQTIVGATDILNSLPAAAAKAGISAITLDPQATAPRLVTRAGSDAIEAFFTFTTDVAHCRGILRLNADDSHPNQYRAWTFFTAIGALIGFEEKTDRNRPTGQSYSRDFRGPNWLDKRLAAASYETHDPAVLVVGGGQAGLAIAARLTQLGIDTLIVDKNNRVGDNWRNRYHALTLHNQLHVNHLPYMPFPPTWPTYIPKDMLALWFASYAAAMELNFWTQCEVTKASYDNKAKRWQVALRTAEDG